MKKTRFMRQLSERFGEPIEELLERIYIEQKKSGMEISNELGIKWSTVYKLLRDFNIPRRTLSEARRGKKQPESFRKKMRKIMKGRKITWEKKVSEALKGKKKSEEHRKHISEGHKGQVPWNKGKKGVQKSTRKGKTYEEVYGYERSKEILKKILKTRLKDSEKYKKLSKELWKNPQYVRKTLKSLFQKPNKSEIKLIRLNEKYGLQFRYVGSGEIMIGGRVPDFIATNGSNKVIELFGRPWHDLNNNYHSPKIDYGRTEEGRRTLFKSHGYELLIIWSNELRNEAGVVEKIKAFMS